MSAEVKSNAPAATVPADEAGVAAIDPAKPPRSRSGPRQWTMCGVLVLAGMLALIVDVPLSRAMVKGQAWQSLHGFLEAGEPFGRPAAVIAVSLAVLLCGGARRGAGFRIAAGALLAGLAVDVLKLCVARIRPRHFNFEGSAFDTFSGMLPGAAAGSALQSWPSGHTAMAVGFCLGLSAVFPRGRWLFRILAVLVALQRIESGAHYASDTLFAASVAVAVHILVFGEGPVARWFDGLEARWAGGDATP